MKTELKSKCCGTDVWWDGESMDENTPYHCKKCNKECKIVNTPQSETPRTDKESASFGDAMNYTSQEWLEIVTSTFARTLERELGELEHRLIDLSIKGTGADTNQFKSVGELAVAGLWNMKELLQQELSQVRGELELAMQVLSGQDAQVIKDIKHATKLCLLGIKIREERDLLAKQLEEANKKIGIHEWEILETRKDVEKLAKQNHKMKEALGYISKDYRWDKVINREIPSSSSRHAAEALAATTDTSSVIVLTRAEVEKLPCNCSGVFAKEGDYKCPRCLLLTRFTQ